VERVRRLPLVDDDHLAEADGEPVPQGPRSLRFSVRSRTWAPLAAMNFSNCCVAPGAVMTISTPIPTPLSRAPGPAPCDHATYFAARLRVQIAEAFSHPVSQPSELSTQPPRSCLEDVQQRDDPLEVLGELQHPTRRAARPLKHLQHGL
jgi:hypothetical protein